MWQLTQHRVPKGLQEISVKALLKEMAEYTYATYAESFESSFLSQLTDIPNKNNFSADLLYKVKQINSTSVEVWKMKPDGDFKYKMFTLDYVGG